MARILYDNRVKFLKDLFSIVLYTNMAAMTSSENRLDNNTNFGVGAGRGVGGCTVDLLILCCA